MQATRRWTVQSIRARMLLYRNTLITIAVAALVATGGAAKETQQSLATKLVAAAHAQDYDAVVRLITAGTYSSTLHSSLPKLRQKTPPFSTQFHHPPTPHLSHRLSAAQAGMRKY